MIIPQNTALGGGGAAYITGYEANFINPANLMIPDRTTGFTMGAGQLGALFIPVTSSENAVTQVDSYLNYMDAHTPGDRQITLDDRNAILGQNYNGNRTIAEHQHRFDGILGGLHWRREDYSVSLTARTRAATRIEVGRGWYDPEFSEADGAGHPTRNMRLIQQSQVFHELSVGYAQTFDFVTGLLPRLGKLYIGIAPKFIVAGSYVNMRYDAQYRLNEEMNRTRLVSAFSYNSSANYSEATAQYMENGNVQRSIGSNFPAQFLPNAQEYTRPSGYGGGVDFGLVYVLSLGDDLTLAQPGAGQALTKSLRLGFSITDLGVVTYTEQPMSVTIPRDTLTAEAASPSQTRFDGTPGQFISFFDNQASQLNPLHNIIPDSDATKTEDRSFTTVLPTSFNAGMLLQIDHLKLAADLTLGLNDTAFNNTRLIGHFGIEVNPIEPIPLRFGMQIASGYPTLWSAGTGIQMKHWELTLGTQLTANSNTSLFELNGAAIGGLTFHF